MRIRLSGPLRILAAALFAILAGTQVVRQALVADGGGRSELARNLWPSHPSVTTSLLMAEVGRAAARGQRPAEGTLELVDQLAQRAPFAPEPYLLHGAIALRGSDYARAEDLLLQARKREPRSAAARYLLADLYLRSGRPEAGLSEMVILTRLMPAASAQLVPALAQFAATPGALERLRSLLRTYPDLKPRLLFELASDRRNADLILALAASGVVEHPDLDWKQRLLSRLVEDGAYAKAYTTWATFAGIPNRPPGLFNPEFRPSDAPKPFNWDLARGAGGVVEGRDGSLHVLYFGRDDLVIARQTLALRPGTYRLSMQVSGTLPDSSKITWVAACVGGDTPLLELPLAKQAGSNLVSGPFTVPGQRCEAQQLELRAQGAEIPERAEFRIGALQLSGGPG